MLSPSPLSSCCSAIAACSGPSCSLRASRRAWSAANASRLEALLCADVLRSSEALPNEKARLRRDFPGRFVSIFKSLRRFAAGESSVGGGGFFGASAGGLGLGASGSVDTGCDNGDGLLVRFSSALPVLLVTELDSDGVPSRACEIDTVSAALFPCDLVNNPTEEADECVELTLPTLSR